jgi:CspA family cold shock protein
MATGKVKFFNKKRCYGFIRDDESGKDIFVHLSDLADRNLREGDEVTFDIKVEKVEGESKKAINVKKKIAYRQHSKMNII